MYVRYLTCMDPFDAAVQPEPEKKKQNAEKKTKKTIAIAIAIASAIASATTMRGMCSHNTGICPSGWLASGRSRDLEATRSEHPRRCRHISLLLLLLLLLLLRLRRVGRPFRSDAGQMRDGHAMIDRYTTCAWTRLDWTGLDWTTLDWTRLHTYKTQRCMYSM